MIRSKGSRQSNRDDMRTTQRASAKNRRLAEQMSRRSGVDQPAASNAAMDKESGRSSFFFLIFGRIKKPRTSNIVMKLFSCPNILQKRKSKFTEI